MPFDKPIHRKALLPVEEHKEVARLPEQMLIPYTAEVNSGDPVAVRLVETIKQLVDVPCEGAISIAPGELLDLLLAHPAMFGVKPIALMSYPDVKYTPEWEQATWALDRVVYGDLITEISAIERVDGALKRQAGSRQKPAERKPEELTRERVRHFDEFKKHRPGDSSAETETEEEGLDDGDSSS